MNQIAAGAFHEKLLLDLFESGLGQQSEHNTWRTLRSRFYSSHSDH